MSQPAPQPTRNQRRGTTPAAANAVAAAHGTAPAVAERRPMTTSTVVAWWRIVVVLSCLVVAVVAPLVLNNNKNSLQRVNAATQQVLLLQSVRGDVLAAEASATQALLLSSPDVAPAADYVDHLSAAAHKLTRAATMTPPDREGLAAANQALVGYAIDLASAMATGSTAQMGIASENLQGVLLPKLDDQIAKNLVWLEVSTADQRWLSVLVAVPIVLMVAASVVVARRTRRLLNVGLLVALAVSIYMWVNVTQLVTTSAQSVSAVQSSGVTQARSVAQAYAAVTEAKAAEGRVLLGVTPAADGIRVYGEATATAAEMLALLPNAEADGMVGQLNQMVATHDQLMAAPAEQRPALVASAQQPYDVLVGWLSQQADQVGSALDQQLSDHARTVQNAVGIVAAGMLGAALAAGIGLSQPMRRYR